MSIPPEPERVSWTAVIAVALLAVGGWKAADVKIGDLHRGVPELRPDSRYNLDNAYLTENYSTSTDVFVVMVQTGADQRTLFGVEQAPAIIAVRVDGRFIAKGIDAGVYTASYTPAGAGGSPAWLGPLT